MSLSSFNHEGRFKQHLTHMAIVVAAASSVQDISPAVL